MEDLLAQFDIGVVSMLRSSRLWLRGRRVSLGALADCGKCSEQDEGRRK